MRFGAVLTITAISAAAFVACFPNDPIREATSGEGGRGGAMTSSGGSKATGGSKTNGGTASSGGATSRGGAGGQGGNNGAGGVTTAGGSRATGSGGGGPTSAGGATGNCTDDAPPGQTPTCEQWVAYNTCGADWFKTYCNRSCGRCSGSGPSGSGGSRGGAGGNPGQGGATGQAGGGGASGPGKTNPQISGSNGWVSRYWDCCKPSCSWKTNVPSCQKDGVTKIGDRNAASACTGGSAYECYDLSPWYDAGTNMSYGFVAHTGDCGTCYMMQFSGSTHNAGDNDGAAALNGQQMIVQKINDGGDVGGDQFDLLVPGGGVGQFNACSNQWGISSSALGAQYGGLLTDCNADPDCMKQKCQSVFGSMPALLAGCTWFTNWYGSADNPSVTYKQVPCPSQITSKSGIGG